MQEADINLEVFTLETDFFGDLYCSSRFTEQGDGYLFHRKTKSVIINS